MIEECGVYLGQFTSCLEKTEVREKKKWKENTKNKWGKVRGEKEIYT